MSLSHFSSAAPSYDAFVVPAGPKSVIQTLQQQPPPFRPDDPGHDGSRAQEGFVLPPHAGYGQDPFYGFDPLRISQARDAFHGSWFDPPPHNILDNVNQRPPRFPESMFDIPSNWLSSMNVPPPSSDPVSRDNADLRPPTGVIRNTGVAKDARKKKSAGISGALPSGRVPVTSLGHLPVGGSASGDVGRGNKAELLWIIDDTKDPFTKDFIVPLAINLYIVNQFLTSDAFASNSHRYEQVCPSGLPQSGQAPPSQDTYLETTAERHARYALTQAAIRYSKRCEY